jgi:hypothetical protein
VEVLAHARGGLGERVARLRVGAHPVPRPIARRLQRGRLAGLGAVGELRRLGEAEGLERGDAVARDALRADRPRRVEGLAPRLLEPGAPEGGEDLERRARLRVEVAEAGDEVAGAELEVDVRGDPAVARACVRRDVAGGVHTARAGLGGDRGHHALGAAVAHDEAAVQRAVQDGEAVEQVRGPVDAAEPAVHEPVVEHEQRHDLVVLGQGPRERRVVVQAQVAPEPDDGGAHHLEYDVGSRPDARRAEGPVGAARGARLELHDDPLRALGARGVVLRLRGAVGVVGGGH